MKTKSTPYFKTMLTASMFAGVSVFLATGNAQAATISGKIFEGKAVTIKKFDGTDTGSPGLDINNVPMPILDVTDPDAAKPEYANTTKQNMNAVAGAKVMVRDYKSGAFVAYGTVAGNSWSAVVPDGGSYVVMFSAPGYDATSRQFDNVTANAEQYAYLAKLKAGNTHKKGNMLVEAFIDNKVNGGPDGPGIDPQLNGVSITVCKKGTTTCVTGVTGSQPASPSAPIVLENQMIIDDMAGMYYFRDLDPGTYTISANAAGSSLGPNNYLTTSLAGGPTQEWNVAPGDVGIMIMPQAPMAEPLVWFGFAKKMGAFPPMPTNTFATVEGIEAGKPLAEVSGTFEFSVAGVAAPAVYVNSQTTVDRLVADINALNAGLTASTIPGGQKTGIKLTANASGQQIVIIKNDTIAVFAQTVPAAAGGGTIKGKCTDADFMPEIGVPGTLISVPGENHPGVSQNPQFIKNCFVIATRAGNNGGVLATTEGDANGNWQFTDVPVGSYELIGNSLDLHYIWQPANVQIQFPGEFIPLVDIWMPNFFGTMHGTVRDTAGAGIAGAKVQVRYMSGISESSFSATTGADGTYTITGLPEIEVLGQVDVTPPAGYRGTLRTETFDPDGPSAINGFIDLYNLQGYCYNCKPPIDVTFNASHRYALWFAMRYQSDFYLEKVPAGSGNISGVVFNDKLNLGTWSGDGVYDIYSDVVVPGATVNLFAQTGTDVTGAPVYATTPTATTTAGVLDEAGAVAQGWMKSIQPYNQWQPLAEPPGLIPLDNFGGVYVGPMPGFYEFRDVPPGNYKVEVDLASAPGFVAVPSSPISVGSTDPANVVVANLGISTSVPLPGELEGGVWDDLFLDQIMYSKIYQEKMAIPGSPVGVYDQFGYRLGSGVMGNPLCWPNVGSIPANIINGGPTCPGVVDITNPNDPALNGSVEMEGRFAPGVNLFLGNDPCLPGGYNNGTNTHEPLLTPENLGQGGWSIADGWALLPFLPVDAGVAQIPPTCRGAGLIPLVGAAPPAPVAPPPPPPVIPVHGDVMRVTGITGVATKMEGIKWYATANVTVNEVYTSVVAPNIVVSGAKINATWLNNVGAPIKSVSCTTSATGVCSFRSETIENSTWASVTLRIDGVTHTNLAIPPYTATGSVTSKVINKP